MAEPTADDPLIPLGGMPKLRFHCTQCGGLTRFEVVMTRRLRTFWHQTIDHSVVALEGTELLRDDIVSVTCSYCNSGEHVECITLEQAAVLAVSKEENKKLQ